MAQRSRGLGGRVPRIHSEKGRARRSQDRDGRSRGPFTAPTRRWSHFRSESWDRPAPNSQASVPRPSPIHTATASHSGSLLRQGRAWEGAERTPPKTLVHGGFGSLSGVAPDVKQEAAPGLDWICCWAGSRRGSRRAWVLVRPRAEAPLQHRGRRHLVLQAGRVPGVGTEGRRGGRPASELGGDMRMGSPLGAG